MTTTLSGSRALVADHKGAVYFAGDDGWDEARQAWNLAVDQQPTAVFVPADADDVAVAVRFATRAGLRVAAQGTGHGAAARSDLGGSILIRTSQLTDVEIDVERRRARAGAGASWAQVVEPATELGLTALHGSAPDVGVVGYSLGGGIGWLARRYGLATNSVTAIELVTAEAEQVRVDAEHDPELFWGLRGGGGNFGVVTAIELALYAVEHVYAGWLIWPWERAWEVFGRWAEWTEQVPDTVTSVARLLQLPPAPFIPEPLRGRNLVVVEAAYLGDEDRGVDLLRPLRALAPELDTFEVVPAIGLTTLHRDPEGPTPGVGGGALFDALPAAAVEALLHAAGPGSGSPLLSLEVRHLGGALAVPARGGGALSHLEAGFALFGVGIPFDADAAAAIEDALRRVKQAIAPYGSGRAYMNFAEAPGADPSTLFRADSYRRLRALRDRVDPRGLFHANHEIPTTNQTRSVR